MTYNHSFCSRKVHFLHHYTENVKTGAYFFTTVLCENELLFSPGAKVERERQREYPRLRLEIEHFRARCKWPSCLKCTSFLKMINPGHTNKVWISASLLIANSVGVVTETRFLTELLSGNFRDILSFRAIACGYRNIIVLNISVQELKLFEAIIFCECA